MFGEFLKPKLVEIVQTTHSVDVCVDTMEPLQNAKSANDNSQSIVHGYLREMESLFEISEVTSLIINIILGFYFQGEYITEYVKENFEISPDKLTITNIKKNSH